jgi:hypothetical protein
MKLEFEVEEVQRGDQENKVFHIKRKGLPVGTLWLDGDQYKKTEEIKEMTLK